MIYHFAIFGHTSDGAAGVTSDNNYRIQPICDNSKKSTAVLRAGAAIKHLKVTFSPKCSKATQ